ncbi:MAG: phosphoenolpyruvate--protein phosphotransferase [Candidatus Aminicenantes bacterium RBG_19FT_COMBO_59_29]|nr:MAG: phosphoenolpyruvate--protein phosphotransferase [Candidatus Aminicenantes bacterium RBG_19FT_COMBO_59_29]
MTSIRLRGKGVSPGIGMGELTLSESALFTVRRESISAASVEGELRRLRKAVERTRNELVRLKQEIKGNMGEEHAFIFDAHLLILGDRSLFDSIEQTVRGEKVRAEWALTQVNQKYQELFDAIADEYFRQRKSDVSDVLARIAANLKLKKKSRTRKGQAKSEVLVAHEILPSEAAIRLSGGNVLAVATDMGGPTSHTAILARSLNIPAVVGLHNITQQVKNGDFIIVDGTDGEVIINPPPAVRKEFLGKKAKYDHYIRELKKTARLKSVTLDDVRFFALANIELPDEVEMAFSYGAEGIGLFRSEFIYLQSASLPNEEDHLAAYSRIAKAAYPAPVYIRTIDIGGDKTLPQLKIEKEPNPALGLRAVRFSLRHKDLFRVQLRAILRASALKNVRILIPMITEVEEIGEVKLLLEEAKKELDKERVKFDRQIPFGVMIEVPAAAAITDILVKEVDYLSIGTNDLIQYYLAVDRSNEFVSYLYKPLHPSVLRVIRFIIQTALREGKDVAVCGEMAADPLSALVLLGFGLRKFSMNPIFIPRIKNTLRSVELKTVEKVVEEAMNLKTAQDVEELVIERILAKHPKAFLLGQVM